MKWAFYSRKAANEFGSGYYRSVTGELVEVTAVYDTKESLSYTWDDKICVGIVTEFVSVGKLPRNNPETYAQ